MLLAIACTIVMAGREKKSIESEPEKPLTMSGKQQTPYMSPEGAYWGTYSSAPFAFLQSYGKTSADVYAQGSEIRTQINSTSGSMKISTEANAGIYKAGAELEAGFIISTSQNNYVMDGTIQVILASQSYDGIKPSLNVISALKIKQTGILRN